MSEVNSLNGSDGGGKAAFDHKARSIQAEFDNTAAALRRKLTEELVVLQAATKQLSAEESRKAALNERFASLMLEKDALTIDITELQRRRSIVATDTKERENIMREIIVHLDKLPDRAEGTYVKCTNPKTAGT
ncbi:conserved hypothetical protein [Neospora caninum Liverpool]|uniref:Uncharacterized protein n=1 Tax=Neospora caninum (strain Liverpool) TaxID=572307 RepID=F0VJL9_NEOCL|nr:conserved hypothetical protein [Neospora caninum Liverpool]CBZ53930.1 conserved hypothetical protein [Neospora caninum Liverpool]CEL67928.1 TPA: hypothetical protein BN1204_037120 [Neospora caninum Liverpool]|eukprot:XP_003883962.1 conserved hypothetical protein [Neospora caninum Liverpool]